jgi:hypothetical protein
MTQYKLKFRRPKNQKKTILILYFISIFPLQIKITDVVNSIFVKAFGKRVELNENDI